MKMRWRKGQPDKSGYYLTWNPMEDDFPSVLHCSINESHASSYEWWTYPMHRSVIEETVSAIIAPMISCFFLSYSDNLETDKKKEMLSDIYEAFNLYESDSHANDVSYSITEMIKYITNSGTARIYDVGRPAFWAELPYLWDLGEKGEEAMVTGDPRGLDIEVEDVKAHVISQIAGSVEDVLNNQMSRFISPWDSKQAPWKPSPEGDE